MAGKTKKDEQVQEGSQQVSGSQGQVDLRGAYDAAGVGGVSSPDTESASRSAQYSAGTQHSSNTQQSSSTQRTGVEGLSDELQAQKARETAQALSAHGVEIDPATGQLRISPNSGTIGDLLGMRESAEEAERRARLKKTASGLYQSLATISDIISGAAGGNVYKREKDTTIADAEKDVQQRKDALLAAEMAAKEQDRKRLEKAAQTAAAINARYDALRNKVSTSDSTAAGESNTQRESTAMGKSSTKSGYTGDGMYNDNGSVKREYARRYVHGDGNGQKYIKLPVYNNGTKTNTFTDQPIDSNKYNTISNYLNSIYSQKLNNKSIREQLVRLGAYDELNQKFNHDILMSCGVFPGLTTAEINEVYRSVGMTPPISSGDGDYSKYTYPNIWGGQQSGGRSKVFDPSAAKEQKDSEPIGRM